MCVRIGKLGLFFVLYVQLVMVTSFMRDMQRHGKSISRRFVSDFGSTFFTCLA